MRTDWTEHLLHRIAVWVSNAYGFPVLASKSERVARLVEEAIELAQAEGLPTEDIQRINARVYSRPVGEAKQEAAGVGVTWLAYCYAANLYPEDIVREEVERIEAIPLSTLRAKHQAKVEAGTALQGVKP